MARYRLFKPGFPPIELEGPAGMSDSQVAEYAQHHLHISTAAPQSREQEMKNRQAFENDRQQQAVLDDMNPGEKALAGSGKAFTDTGLAAQQMLAVADPQKRKELQARVQHDQQFSEPLMNTGAGQAGNILTNAGIALAPGAAIGGAGRAIGSEALQMAGRELMVPRSPVGGMAQGALSGAAVPTTDNQSTAENIGISGVAGAALPLIGRSAVTAKAAAEPFTESGKRAISGRLLNDAAGADRQAVLDRLKNAQELVPGSSPTAAQVAGSGGIGALERGASAGSMEMAGLYTQRQQEQAAARRQAIRGIAGSDADIAAAQQKREFSSSQLYKEADQGVARVDDKFRTLMNRPQFKAAVARAEELARDDGLAGIFFKDANGEPAALIGKGGHYIKKALDEAAEPTAKSYTGKQGEITAGNTNKIFQDWLDKSIPEYRLAKDVFAQHSAPINQMQVGKLMHDKLISALSESKLAPRERASIYAEALRNGDHTAATATGFPGATLEKVMTPEQMQTLKGVKDDLARASDAAEIGRGPGSNTAQNISVNNVLSTAKVPSLLGQAIAQTLSGGVKQAGKLAYSNADEEMRRILAQALLNPREAAQLMEQSALPGNTERLAMMLRYGNPAAVGAATSNLGQ